MVTQILIGAGGIAIGAVVAFIIQSALKQSAMTVAAKLKAEAGREAEHVLREAKVTARAEILKMRDEQHCTVVIVTHELDSVFAIADRIIMLDKQTGTIIANGDPRKLRSQCSIESVRNFLNRNGARDNKME